MTLSPLSDVYYPPPESQGGWRYLLSRAEIRHTAGFNPDKIDEILKYQQLLYGDSFSIVIIRHGYLVKEFYTFSVLVPTRYDIWSCTKTTASAG